MVAQRAAERKQTQDSRPIRASPSRPCRQGVFERWRMAQRVVPLSEQIAAFHKDLVAYHWKMARKHSRYSHADAIVRHQQAVVAHQAAAAAPFDQRVTGAAMRASSIADQASQKVGVRPLLPWPAKGR